MITIQNLQKATTDINTLQSYLDDNFEDIYDFFTIQKHSALREAKNDLKKYIALNWIVISKLDKNSTRNLSFISLLLDVCERLGLKAQFILLIDFLLDSSFTISNRIKAASLSLINVKTINDYLNRYSEIYELLQISYDIEEDNQDKVITTFVNYFSQVLVDFGDFNINSVKLLKEKIENTLSENEYSFLKNLLILDVLRVDLTDFSLAYQKIHALLDSFLGRDIVKPKYNPNYLLEENTEYAKLLENVDLNFSSIRQISVNQYQRIKSDSIYHSLQRGVKILTEENQLFAYMHSFGKMHYEKLNTSFVFLPQDVFNEKINIIDWGCGQAMASMTYFDFLNYKNIQPKINQITLIEPSEIALKRGVLHIKKYLLPRIKTINKDLDSLLFEDFNNNDNLPNLHLFSNILDIDLFSLANLLQLINKSCRGINYFVCVSPFITDLKNSRLDAFVKHFSKNENFKEIISINNRKGEWQLNDNWTRVVRVFQTDI